MAKTPAEPSGPPRTEPTLKPGLPVSGADFFGRDKEVSSFWRQIEQSNVLMVSPRRVGKTSLMHHIRDNPAAGWATVFVDVEGKASAAAVLLAVVEALDKRGGIGKKIAGSVFQALSQIDSVGAAGVSLKFTKVAKDHWDFLSAEFERAIAAGATKNERLLLIVDEFPIVIRQLFSAVETKQDAVNLLQLFRKIRMDTGLKDRFRMVVGGSIGLKPVLRRQKATAEANDLKPFRVGPWSNAIARKFMDGIGRSSGLNLSEPIRAEVFKRVGDTPIPYYLQVMLDRLVGLELPSEAITAAEVEAVWQESLGDVDLDHYQERLPDVLGGDEAEAASLMLDKVALEGARLRTELAAVSSKRGVSSEALRVLVEDGYLVERSTPEGLVLAFSNPMIEAFWRKHCL